MCSAASSVWYVRSSRAISSARRGSVSAYNVAAYVPSMLFDLLVGGFVEFGAGAMFSELAARKNRGELWRLLSLLLSVAVVFLSIAVLVLELFAPQVARLMAGGFDRQLLQTTTNLLRLTVPAVLFLSMSAIVSGALYALKRFAFPAFAAPLFNLATIIVTVLLAPQLGIAAMALGLLLGSIVQLLLCLPGLRGATLRWHFDLRDSALRRILKLYLPRNSRLDHRAGGDCHQPEPRVAHGRHRHRADGLSHAPDSVSARLDRQRGVDRDPAVAVALRCREFDARISRDAGAGLAAGVGADHPFDDWTGVLGPNIVGLLYEHGAFTSADTQAVTLMLWLYLIGLIFAGIDQPLVFAFYARKDTLTPAVVGLICNVGIYLGVAIVPPALNSVRCK